MSAKRKRQSFASVDREAKRTARAEAKRIKRLLRRKAKHAAPS
jgi:hypothetical protein